MYVILKNNIAFQDISLNKRNRKLHKMYRSDCIAATIRICADIYIYELAQQYLTINCTTWDIFGQPLLNVIVNLIDSCTKFSGRKPKAKTKKKEIQRKGENVLGGKQLNNLNFICTVSNLNWAIIQNQIEILI